MSRLQKTRGFGFDKKYRTFYVILFLMIFACLISALALHLSAYISLSGGDGQGRRASSNQVLSEVLISQDSIRANATVENCTFHTCFDVYHCGYNGQSRISVYIYPETKYIDVEGKNLLLAPSREFGETLGAIRESVYHTMDPTKACLFVPPLDLLNQNTISLEQTAKILASLPR